MYVKSSFSICLLILVYIFSIFCAETISGFKDYFSAQLDKAKQNNENNTLTDERHKDHHPLYVPFYLLYQMCLLVLISTALCKFAYLAEVMAGVIFFYSIVLFCWRPYSLSIHNNANIYNQTVLMLFFGFSILGKIMPLGDDMKLTVLYGTLGLITIALLIQMARVYVFSKSEKQKFMIEKQTK